MSLDLQTEPGGLVAELCAKLDLHIGSTEKLQRNMVKALRKPPTTPVFGRTAGVGTFTTAEGTHVFRLGQRGPDQGHVWYIRSLVIGGLNPSLAVAGRADVYVSASDFKAQPNLTAMGLGDWRDWADFTPGVAQVAFYGRGELELRFNEKVFIVVTGGTNNQMYVAAASYEDWEESPIDTQEWSL